MEKNINSITFEDLDKNIINETNELYNENFYKSNDFLELYYKKYNKLPKEEERKEEYNKWHRDLGKNIYDVKNNKFIKNISLIEKIAFLRYHPLLTHKDMINLKVLKNNLEEKHKRSFLISYISGMVLFSIYINIKMGKGNLRKYVFSNKRKIFIFIILSVFSFDIVYKLALKNEYVNQILEHKGMKKKYFDDYLI